MEVLLKHLEDNLKKIQEHLGGEFIGLQIGRASSALVERLMVNSYGTMQPLKAVASVSVPDAKTVQIQPWDKNNLKAIENAIQISDLGLTPQNDGLVIRINVPELTEERRKELTKIIGKMEEEAKIAVRNVRQEVMTTAKNMEKNNEITEDQLEVLEKKIQELVDKMNEAMEHSAKAKEEDIMKI